MTEEFKKQIETEARQAVTELLAQAKLKKGDVFVVGCSSSEIVGGHIGKDSHIRLDSADAAALAEIQKTDETLRAILGDGDYWLRPPWGFASDALKSAVSVPLIYWTIDTMDWSVRNRDLVAHHIIENAKSGDIVLLHDPYNTSVEAALQTIDVLSEQGYEFVTLEELFSNADVTPQAGHFYLRADEEVPW